jgi:hypothetical protein
MKYRFIVLVAALTLSILLKSDAHAQQVTPSYNATYECSASLQGEVRADFRKVGNVSFYSFNFGAPIGSFVGASFFTTFNLPSVDGRTRNIGVSVNLNSGAISRIPKDYFPLQTADISLVDNDGFKVLSYSGTGGLQAGGLSTLFTPPTTQLRAGQGYSVSSFIPLNEGTSLQVICNVFMKNPKAVVASSKR